MRVSVHVLGLQALPSIYFLCVKSIVLFLEKSAKTDKNDIYVGLYINIA